MNLQCECDLNINNASNLSRYIVKYEKYRARENINNLLKLNFNLNYKRRRESKRNMSCLFIKNLFFDIRFSHSRYRQLQKLKNERKNLKTST